MFAVVDIAGQQFKVSNGEKIYVNKLDEKEGSSIKIDKVLLIDDQKHQQGEEADDSEEESYRESYNENENDDDDDGDYHDDEEEEEEEEESITMSLDTIDRTGEEEITTHSFLVNFSDNYFDDRIFLLEIPPLTPSCQTFDS